AVDDEETIQRFVIGIAACKHAALAQLEDEQLASRRIIEIRRERTNTRILIAESKTGLSLVRSDEIEALKVRYVSPAAGDLTVGNAEAGIGQCLHQLRNGAAIEKAMAEVREHYRIGGHASQRPRDVVEDLVGNGAVVQRIHLQESIAADNDG